MKILTLRHKDSSVFNYRMMQTLEKRLGAKTRKCLLRKNEKLTIEELAKRYKKLCDVLVIKYIDHEHTLDVIYSMAKMGGFKVAVDIDDNLWQIPLGNIARGDNKTFINRSIMLSESVKSADWVTVATEPLKTILAPLNERIVVLPNLIDPKDWKFKRKKHDKVRIGWVYSQTHTPDIAEVEEALEKIYDKYKDKVEIVIFGIDHDIFNFPTVNIPSVKYTDYPKVFTEAGIDISIAPLLDNDFNRCKSNIKWLESTMAGACFVGSKVYPYEYSVKHGKTGYLASTNGQWYKHLSNLIENPEKRKELQENALKEILENFDINKNNVWEKFYESIQ